MIDKNCKKQILNLINQYPKKESALMPSLMIIQKNNNNTLSKEDIKQIAKIIGISASKAFGVASFYSLYNLKPVGKYHLQIDSNIPAVLMGANDIIKYLEDKLKIKAGETTSDGMFTLTKVEDLASCGTCPVIQVNDTYYEDLTIEDVDYIIETLKKGKMPEKKATYNYGSEYKILLKNRNIKNSININTYKNSNGYKALKKALQMNPKDIIEEVKNSELKGRGGAGFPTGIKWNFLPKDNNKPVYLICNADEGEPGTFKDRQIMEYDPHLLIEGMAITAHAINAKTSFIYIRGEFIWIADILEKAINEAKEDGLLSHVNIIIHRGAGAYVCGEETALIESIEGKRGNPRIKPPYPANIGLYNCPTIINNVETLACIPYIIENSAKEFKKIGVTNNYGPKLFGVSGHVHKPGVYEYPLGTPLTTILNAAGGVKGKLKGVIVGGLSVPILKANEVKNLKLDFDSCIKAGTMLGSGGIIVINEEASIPEIALRTIKFYQHESCGQCTPCREGSTIITSLLEKILTGLGEKKDIDYILNICKTVKGLGICPTVDAFALPIEAMIEKFREEFDSLIKQ